MKVVTRATMSVYEGWRHRTWGNVDPQSASVINKNQVGLGIFDAMLEKLQKKGVKPGAKLRITIEVLR